MFEDIEFPTPTLLEEDKKGGSFVEIIPASALFLTPSIAEKINCGAGSSDDAEKALDEETIKLIANYDRKHFKLYALPKVIPLRDIERDTYKFEFGLGIKCIHPYFTQYSIENDNKEFKCKYRGMSLNGKPHGLGRLELILRDEDEDEDDDEDHESNRSD